MPSRKRWDASDRHDMCGIAGLVEFQGTPDESTLRAMERSILHRGPDEGGFWSSGPVGLVHRRLRIIDLSPLGAQPMANEDGQVQVVFNGEIYNHHSLREELLKLGHTFRSRSDTEVLVHGYESWGTDLIRRLRGMFAFAIWDVREQKLLMARDRVGKKPLFYGTHEGRFVFGSELDVFKAVPCWPLRVSLQSYRQYLKYGYVLSPHTVLEGVSRLPAGHFGVLNQSGLEICSYWSLPAAPGPNRASGDAHEAAEHLEGVLREAVACRLESDVPLGCFLSGGVDSSLVAALAQESLGRPLQTYTVGFENSPASEAAHARQVASHLGTQHHELSVNPRSMVTEFEEILSGAAEPLGDDSYVPTFLISRETRRFVTVALSGDGGDELFAGYEKYRQFAAAQPWRRLPLPWKLISRLAPSDAWHKKASALSSGSEMELARWLSTLWKAGEPDALLASPVARDLEPDLFESAWRLRSEFQTIERWMLADVETYLEGDILVKVDRASMAVALEGRSPFLDVPFMEEAMRWSCRAVQSGGGKTILKMMLARRMPVDWFERPKQGFGLPIDQWFRGELRDVLKRCTHPDRLRKRGLLRPEAVQTAVDAHLSGRRNFARKLYALVAFELWADRFFGSKDVLA